MNATISIDYTVHIWKEEAQYIAHAVPLDVTSAGPNPDEARKALGEAIQLFLATAAYMGTLEDVLQESGYEFSPGGWVRTA